MNCFNDSHIGVATGGAKVEQITQCDGETKLWKASTDDVWIFGAKVSCQMAGYGRTQEQALNNLELEKRKLSESLWY